MLVPSIFRNDSFFDDFFDVMPTRKTYMPTAAMKCDVRELDNAYEIDMQLPGYDKSDVQVELKDGYLTVSASHEDKKEDKEEGKYIRKECFTGSCERSFYVGDQITKDDVKASFSNGILKLTIPQVDKLPDKEEPKQLVDITD